MAPERTVYRRVFWVLGQAFTAIGAVAFVGRFHDVGAGAIATEFFAWWHGLVDQSLGAALRLVLTPLGSAPPDWLADLLVMSGLGAYFWRESLLLQRPVWLHQPGGEASYRRLGWQSLLLSLLLGSTGLGILYFFYPLAAAFELVCFPDTARDLIENVRGKRAYGTNSAMMVFRLRIWAGAALAVAVFFVVNAYV